MSSKIWAGLLLGAVLGAATIAAAPSVAVADDACGSKEKPCPLQKWMRQNMGPANAAGDMPALAVALDKAAALAPDPSWNGNDPKVNWDAIAKAAAAAARANDAVAVKAACKCCHERWKEKYKTQFRTRPVSG